jgi:hypothetical protein
MIVNDVHFASSGLATSMVCCGFYERGHRRGHCHHVHRRLSSSLGSQTRNFYPQLDRAGRRLAARAISRMLDRKCTKWKSCSSAT